MSLILEALRKSEAERRRGQAPGLFVEQVPVPTRRRSRTPVWAWGMVVMLAGVLLAWGWREFGGRGTAGGATTPGGSSSAPAAQVSAAATAASATPDGASPRDAVAGDGSALPQSPSHPLPPGAAPQGDGASTTKAPAAAATFGAATDTPTPQAPGAVSRPASGVAPDAASASAATSSPAVAAVPGQSPASVEAGRPIDDAAPVATAPSRLSPEAPPAIADTADEPPLPRLSELPGDERSQLPALKLSMHVFAEDPAQRFVILDGKRLREGDSPAAGVVLEAIRRDGLVISVNGRRLLLARP
jgi:general secretion pathway protein B